MYWVNAISCTMHFMALESSPHNKDNGVLYHPSILPRLLSFFSMAHLLLQCSKTHLPCNVSYRSRIHPPHQQYLVGHGCQYILFCSCFLALFFPIVRSNCFWRNQPYYPTIADRCLFSCFTDRIRLTVSVTIFLGWIRTIKFSLQTGF